MRRLHETLAFEYTFNLFKKSILKIAFPTIIWLAFASLSLADDTPSGEETTFEEACELNDLDGGCDNVLDGGLIAGDETDCPNPDFDPAPIINVSLPNGGTGTLEYIWIFTTDVPGAPPSAWQPILNSNSPEFDPPPITVTTYYRRCVRRAGCLEYAGESNIIVKKAQCCDNVTDGGEIAGEQIGCGPAFDPAQLTNVTLPSGGCGTLEYLWFSSSLGTPYFPGSPDWVALPNSDTSAFDPSPLTQTTWFIRTVRRSDCELFEGVSNIVKITVLEAPVVELGILSEIQCNGNSNGGIDLTISGNDAPYQIQWDNGLGNVEDPTGLVAGVYSVTVSGNNGCATSKTVTLPEPLPLTATLSASNQNCFGTADGTATAVISGGTPGYTLLWSDSAGQTTATATDLLAGTYFVTVSDANNCSIVESVVVAEAPFFGIQVSATDVSCFGLQDGSATVGSIVGGLPPFSFEWDDPEMQSTQTAVNLAGGVYHVLVTDAAGCTIEANAEVNEPALIMTTITSTDVMCGGQADGSATVNVTGGAGGYSYQWDDPDNQTTATAQNLAAGTYHVTVTDTNGCTGKNAVTIFAPMELDFSITSTNVTCPGDNDGTALVLIANGDPIDFTYQWDDPNNSSNDFVFGLPAGTYHVTITAQNGCTDIGTVVIEEPSPLVVDFSVENTSCSDTSDGSVLALPSGGSGAYTFQWNDPQHHTTQSLNNLLSGIYKVTVTDSNGCTATGSAFVNSPQPIQLSFVKTNATCATTNDGTATVSATGGTPGFNFQWDDPLSQTTGTISFLGQGLYQVTVTDANDCEAIDSVEIGVQSAFSIEVFSEDILCFGDANGRAWVTALGDTSNLSYQWDNPANSTTNFISGLAQGNYHVTVTNANGCTETGSISIAEPGPLFLFLNAADVTCPDDSSGVINTTVLGGTPSFAFEWDYSADATTNVLNNLPVGNYNLTVTDANGCQKTASAAINFTSDLSATASAQNVSCFGGNDGEAIVKGVDGVPPYSYRWSNNSINPIQTNLTAGLYFVTTTDFNGCSFVNSVQVEQPDLLQCEASISAPITTFGGNEGAVTANASGGIPPYTFQWSNGDNTPAASNLSAGTYGLTITDSNGCTCSTTIFIENPSKIGDFVWDDINENGWQNPGEPGLPGITVILSGTTGSGNPFADTTQTDANGFYQFDGLEPGFYKLHFGLLPNYFFTDMDIGTEEKDSDVNPFSGFTNTIPLAVGTFNSDVDAGLIKLDDKINIGDFVWLDFNRNGIQDSIESGLQEIKVKLLSMPTGSVVATTSTNLIGFYEFKNVFPGNYVVEFSKTSLPTGFVFTSKNQGSDDEVDSDANPLNGFTDVFEVLPFTPDNLTIDAGVFQECDNITDGGSIQGNENLCGLGADPAPITELNPASGGFGTLEFIWLQSNVPIFNGPGDPNWTMIPNSNSPDLDPGPITQTTYYIRCARRSPCTDFIGESNIISKVVVELPLTNIEVAPSQLCTGESGLFKASIAGGGATYAWDFGNDAVPQTANTRVVSSVIWNTSGQKTVQLTVTRFGCSFSTSTTVSIVNCLSPLINMGRLQATLVENSVELSWSAETDDSELLFLVQRSEDGNTFQTIGGKAAKEADQNGGYQFMDENPFLGNNYYRIKFRQADGTDGYSEVETVFLQPSGISNFQFYPNPFSMEATLEILKPQDNSISIQLINGFGQIMKSVDVPSNTEKVPLDFAQLPNGMYYLRIKGKGTKVIGKRIFKAD